MYDGGTRTEHKPVRSVPRHLMPYREVVACPLRNCDWRRADALCHSDAGSLDAKAKCGAGELHIGT